MIFISKKRKILALLLLLGALCIMSTVQASAASPNVVKTAKTVSGGKWYRTSAGRLYRCSNRTWARNTWLRIGSGIYRFNAKGVCQTGWISYGGKRYFADKNGKLYVSRFRTVGTAKCYFLADGSLAVNRWVQIGKKYYYFSGTGRMVTNSMFAVGKKYYYVNRAGVRMSNLWVKLGGKRYFFDSRGVRVENQWMKRNGKYYYLDEDGVLAVSRWVGRYYVSASGVRLTNCTVGGYYLDASGKRTVKVFKGDYIMVGDSRMVGVSETVSDENVKFIAKVGAGYSWLKTTAGPELENYLKANPKVKVVFALGINDFGNLSSYISYYRSIMKKYPKTKFYIQSINPVEEKLTAKRTYPVTDRMIRRFNARMYTAFSSVYLNSYSYLQKKGYETIDGLHYNRTTSRRIYNYVIAKVGS